MVKHGMQQLSRLQETVAHQSQTIENLNDSVSELHIEASVQRDATARLRRSLQENTQLLRDSIMRYQEDKKAQDSLIAQQQSAIEMLQLRRCKRDFVVDGILAIVCLGVANITLIDAPLRFLLRIVPPGRFRNFLRQLVKLILVAAMFLQSRRLAVGVGLHSSCGSPAAYLTHVLRVFQRLQRHTASASPGRAPLAAPPTPARAPPATPARSALPQFLGSPIFAGVVTPSQWTAD